MKTYYARYEFPDNLAERLSDGVFKDYFDDITPEDRLVIANALRAEAAVRRRKTPGQVGLHSNCPSCRDNWYSECREGGDMEQVAKALEEGNFDDLDLRLAEYFLC